MSFARRMQYIAHFFTINSFKEIILPVTTPCARAVEIGRYRQPPGDSILPWLR